MNPQQPFKPYVIDGTNRHLQFFVPDAEKAWACAKDIESWLRLNGNSASLQLQTGIPGQVGVTYLKTETRLSGGGDTPVRQHSSTETYTLRSIDENQRKLTFDVLYGGETRAFDGPRRGMKQMFVQVDRNPQPQGGYLVRFTTTGHRNGRDTPLPLLVFCIVCCFLEYQCATKQMKHFIDNQVTQLQHHFTVYQPVAQAQAGDDKFRSPYTVPTTSV